MNYNAMELMICCAARLLEDGSSVAVGTGVPCAAAMLAQRTVRLILASFSKPAALARSCRLCRSAWATHEPFTAASWPQAWPM